MPPQRSQCPQCEAPLEREVQVCPACGVPPGQAAQPATRPRREWLRPACLLVLALGLLAFAGFRLAPYWPRSSPRMEGVAAKVDPQAANRPDVPFEAVLSKLVLLPSKQGQGRAALGLARPEYPDRLSLVASKSIFPYEVMRQAVLEASRTSFGITTRDETLGELLPEGQGKVAGFMAGRFELGHRPAIILGRGDTETGKIVGTVELGKKDVPNLIYVQLIEMAEAAARVDLPRVLKDLGLTGAPLAQKPSGPVPEAVEERLWRMTCAEQFAALRALHQLVRDDGESPERLGALARGYAHLGVLTEFYWNSSHHAYKARALLISQRMVARDAKSPLAFWHRAYARALAGYHQGALNDLTKARELSGDGSQPKPPVWVSLIDAYCHFRTDTLRAANSGQKAELASLLAFLTNEQSISSARPLELGRALLTDNAECYRVYDALCDFGGVANLHTATVAPIAAFSQRMPQRLAQLPDLPEKTADLLKNRGSERDVVRSLRDAGRWPDDSAELSWTVLGGMLQEIRFAQVCRRLYFMRFKWSVPVDDELAALRTLVEDHPYRAAVDSFGVDPRSESERFGKLADQVNIVDIEYSASPYLYNLWQYNRLRWQRASELALNHTDGGHGEVAILIKKLNDDDAKKRVLQLRSMSPFSPFGRAKMIEIAWDKVSDRARQWEAAAVDQPDVLFALGRQYAKDKKWSDAQRCLTAALKLSPDRQCYELLAQTYKDQGDMDHWKETLDDSLKQPDNGLDHAQVRVAIANYFMGQNQFDKAQPYAEAAAQSWAGWAMQCAVRCYEGQKNWERAEFWVRQLSERYANSRDAWFLWCKRVGKGDVASAHALALQHLIALKDNPDPEQQAIFGYFLALGGQTQEAVNVLQKLDTGPIAVGCLLYAALLADDLKDTALRDKLLNRVCDDMGDQSPFTVRTARLFREALKSGKPLDMEAVNKILSEYPAERRGNLEFFIGRFLMRHGSRDDAKKHLRESADSSGTYIWFRETALDLLHQLQQDPS